MMFFCWLDETSGKRLPQLCTNIYLIAREVMKILRSLTWTCEDLPRGLTPPNALRDNLPRRLSIVPLGSHSRATKYTLNFPDFLSNRLDTSPTKSRSVERPTVLWVYTKRIYDRAKDQQWAFRRAENSERIMSPVDASISDQNTIDCTVDDVRAASARISNSMKLGERSSELRVFDLKCSREEDIHS